MDKSLIWLLVPGTLLIIYYLRVSNRYQHKNYDLEEYLQAGKRLSGPRFFFAMTAVTLLGIMPLPHMGLFYRSGFSYGSLALAAIIIPLVSALFARRLWILSRIFTPLTPAQLLGDYYRSARIRGITAFVAVLFALTLAGMSLRLGTSLVEALFGNSHSLTSLVTLFALALLMFLHTIYGGMGAILRVAAPVGLFLMGALILSALVSIDAAGGFPTFFDLLAHMQNDPINAPLFTQSRFFNPLPAAAPDNMAWPGAMVATSLLALAGLATAPVSLMLDFTPAKSSSHAPQQFFAAALMTGLLFVSTTIVVALLPRLATEIAGFPAANTNLMKTGLASTQIITLLKATPLGHPLLLGLIALSLMAGLVASTSAALLAAGGMVANDIFYEKLKKADRPSYRRSIIRFTVGAVLIMAVAAALLVPTDPLPLFLLAGALGLQLLPALSGLCYFKSLGARSICFGMVGGIFAVLTTSTLLQGLLGLLGVSLPFDAWPLSLHPAFWGLGTNLAILLATRGLANKRDLETSDKRALSHRRSYHYTPDEQALMAPDARFWSKVALSITTLFLITLALPLTGMALPALGPASFPAMWSWQILSWLTGLALVYVVAYRLQPVFDPGQFLHGSLTPQKWRFRVKAQSRKLTNTEKQ